MGIKAINYENLQEGDLITWYGMHVLRWEDEIRPYGIEPSIAFVQDDTQEILIGELLEVLKQVKMDIEFESLGLGDLKKQIKQAIAKAKGE